MKKKILSLAVIAAIGTFASAQSNKFEIGAIGNFEYTNNHSALQEHIKSYGLRGNYRILDSVLLGLEYNRADNHHYKNGNEKTDLQRYFLNAFYEADGDVYTPYAFIGAGYQDIDKELFGMDDGLLGQAGVGFKYGLLDFLNIFIEGKVIQDFENELTDFAIGAGLSIPFGFEGEKEVKVKDSDNDGVNDDLDMCPNTPAGVKVDSKGCPLDSDGDGVPDYKDKCPGTPAGVEVDANGCELVKDSDGDGIIDSLDECPDTPKGVAVDAKGCPIIINLNINFDFNSAKIKPEYMPKIKELAEFLKKNYAYKAEIQGHTDSIGSAAYNKKLSEKRAKAVYEALIKMGVDKNRLSYIGYGEAHPIAPNTTPEGRAKNRRVEVHLLY